MESRNRFLEEFEKSFQQEQKNAIEQKRLARLANRLFRYSSRTSVSSGQRKALFEKCLKYYRKALLNCVEKKCLPIIYYRMSKVFAHAGNDRETALKSVRQAIELLSDDNDNSQQKQQQQTNNNKLSRVSINDNQSMLWRCLEWQRKLEIKCSMTKMRKKMPINNKNNNRKWCYDSSSRESNFFSDENDDDDNREETVFDSKSEQSSNSLKKQISSNENKNSSNKFLEEGVFEFDQNCFIDRMENDPKGRHLRCNGTIPYGTFIIQEKVLSSIFFPKYFMERCFTCYREIEKVFYPCRQCNRICFCDSKCESLAFDHRYGFHWMECGLVSILSSNSNAWHVYRLISACGGLSTVLKFYQDKSNQTTTIYQSELIDEYIDDERINGNRFRPHQTSIPITDECRWRLLSLIDSLTDRGNEINTINCATTTKTTIAEARNKIFKNWAMKIIVLLHFHRAKQNGQLRSTDFFDDLVNEKSGQTDQTLLWFLIEKIRLLIEKVGLNAFGWCEHDWVQLNRPKVIGTCVCVVSSLINHSCNGNAFWNIWSGQMTISTSSKIEPNDEIRVSYGPSPNQNVWRRQKLLKNNYGFICDCRACWRDVCQHQLCLKCLHCRRGPIFSFQKSILQNRRLKKKNEEMESYFKPECLSCHRFEDAFIERCISTREKSMKLLFIVKYLMTANQSNLDDECGKQSSKIKRLIIQLADDLNKNHCFDQSIHHQSRTLFIAKIFLSNRCNEEKKPQKDQELLITSFMIAQNLLETLIDNNDDDELSIDNSNAYGVNFYTNKNDTEFLLSSLLYLAEWLTRVSQSKSSNINQEDEPVKQLEKMAQNYYAKILHHLLVRTDRRNNEEEKRFSRNKQPTSIDDDQSPPSTTNTIIQCLLDPRKFDKFIQLI